MIFSERVMNSPLTERRLLQLQEIASDIREDLLCMLTHAKSGHTAGPLGMADIFTALYFHLLHHDPKRPDWAQRDRLILSNGHIVPIRYATMARAGYFPQNYLWTLRTLGSPLQGHPERHALPGLETTSGPLGSGTSQAAGMAFVGKQSRANWRVYCILSDGEMGCGQTWEAFLFAAKNKLNNCTFIVDRNFIQIDGPTEHVMPLEPLTDKLAAFGLHVETCVGNEIRSFVEAVEQAKAVTDRPTIIVANTIPGRGVGFMEYDFTWHGKPPRQGKELQQALKAIRTLRGKIKDEQS